MLASNFIILATPAPISHRTAEENLGLGYLAAVLREKGYNVKIIDGWLQGLTPEKLAQAVLSESVPLFVGFSVYQSNMNMAVKTINIIKQFLYRHQFIEIWLCGTKLTCFMFLKKKIMQRRCYILPRSLKKLND